MDTGLQNMIFKAVKKHYTKKYLIMDHYFDTSFRFYLYEGKDSTLYKVEYEINKSVLNIKWDTLTKAKSPYWFDSPEEDVKVDL